MERAHEKALGQTVCGCGITRSGLAKIEAGQRHVYPDELKLLREIPGVSYDELFV